MLGWALCCFVLLRFVFIFVYISPSLFCRDVIGCHVDVNCGALGLGQVNVLFIPNYIFCFTGGMLWGT